MKDMGLASPPPFTETLRALRKGEPDMRNIMSAKGIQGAVLLLAAAPVLAVCGDAATAPGRSDQGGTGTAGASANGIGAASHAFAVSGSAIHYFSTAAVHSQQPTQNGMVQRSSEIIRLTGDLDGYILYHPTSTFDFAAGTLTNTGTQIFSGTVAGSAPVILHDDSFRFVVQLATGETHGEVHLARSKDAHGTGWFRCDLTVVGTGLTAEGDAMADYSGECSRFGSLR
jgi:hypothetical protein